MKASTLKPKSELEIDLRRRGDVVQPVVNEISKSVQIFGQFIYISIKYDYFAVCPHTFLFIDSLYSY